MFKISIIISRRDLAAAITLSRFSRVAKSDVETRRAFTSVTAIISVEDNFVNIDAKNNKTISSVIERSIVFDWQNFIVSSIMFD